ncbi:hypothetical protein [Tropicimonas sp. S265A]
MRALCPVLPVLEHSAFGAAAHGDIVTGRDLIPKQHLGTCLPT